MKKQDHLSPAILIELMERQRYGVEYQPIIAVKNQEIYAYESLARFFDSTNTPIRPDIVYSSLHESPLSLFQVEYQQKKLQLSYAPNKVDIFVNLDQESEPEEEEESENSVTQTPSIGGAVLTNPG